MLKVVFINIVLVVILLLIIMFSDTGMSVPTQMESDGWDGSSDYFPYS